MKLLNSTTLGHKMWVSAPRGKPNQTLPRAIRDWLVSCINRTGECQKANHFAILYTSSYIFIPLHHRTGPGMSLDTWRPRSVIASQASPRRGWLRQTQWSSHLLCLNHSNKPANLQHLSILHCLGVVVWQCPLFDVCGDILMHSCFRTPCYGQCEAANMTYDYKKLWDGR